MSYTLGARAGSSEVFGHLPTKLGADIRMPDGAEDGEDGEGHETQAVHHTGRELPSAHGLTLVSAEAVGDVAHLLGSWLGPGPLRGLAATCSRCSSWVGEQALVTHTTPESGVARSAYCPGRGSPMYSRLPLVAGGPALRSSPRWPTRLQRRCLCWQAGRTLSSPASSCEGTRAHQFRRMTLVCGDSTVLEVLERAHSWPGRGYNCNTH